MTTSYFISETADSDVLAKEKIQEARQTRGYALDNYFYRSSIIYKRELRQIILKSWIYACHTSEIPNNGDFQTLEIGEDSIIIARDKEGNISASANTCRHRGSRVCTEKSGNARSFVCPYHAWVYEVNGKLIGARSMGDDFRKEDHSLKNIRTHIFQGMIFINCDEKASDFKPETDRLIPFLKPYHLEEAKVAASRTYTIQANWKLALENYLECYHCGPSHKEYAKSHSLKEEPGKAKDLNDAMKQRAAEKMGFGKGFVKDVSNQYSHATAFGCDISHMRYALYEKYKTGSLDGESVAPLMGEFTGYDGGVGDFQIGPLTFMLNYPDHCVLYRFLPKGMAESEIEIVWFVNGDAVEGKDYEVDRLVYLWDLTTKEDKRIITLNAAGVSSSFYEPGPYSPVFETLCMNFVSWYLKAIGG